MHLIKQYFALKNAIHEYFGYKEDWSTIPLSDEMEYEWMLIGNGDNSRDRIVYGKKLNAETLESGEVVYSANLYIQRFLQKWVYRAEEHTMICADTRCDGNKFLMIFSNEKEITDPALKDVYLNNWSW